MYVHGSVYVYILPSGLYNCILVAKDRLCSGVFVCVLFLRESDQFLFGFFLWREIIQGFYLGELLRKAKRLKSGMPLAQMVSLTMWETLRPTETSSRHITLKRRRPLTTESSFYISIFFSLQLSGLFHHRMDLTATFPSLDHVFLDLQLEAFTWLDWRSDPEFLDRSSEPSESPSKLQPPPSLSRPQSALCCSVSFTVCCA